MTIRITKRVDSETLHLPKLRPLIGKTVKITIEEAGAKPAGGKKVALRRPPKWMRRSKSPREVAAGQGKRLRKAEEWAGGWPEKELKDGFEQAVQEWRNRELKVEQAERGRTFK